MKDPTDTKGGDYGSRPRGITRVSRGEHRTKSNFIIAVAVDSQNKWFGTRSRPLQIDGKVWTTYTTENGLGGNFVHAVTLTGTAALGRDQRRRQPLRWKAMDDLQRRPDQ